MLAMIRDFFGKVGRGFRTVKKILKQIRQEPLKDQVELVATVVVGGVFLSMLVLSLIMPPASIRAQEIFESVPLVLDGYLEDVCVVDGVMQIVNFARSSSETGEKVDFSYVDIQGNLVSKDIFIPYKIPTSPEQHGEIILSGGVCGT